MKLLVIAFCIVALSLGLFSELGGGIPTLNFMRRGQEKTNPNRNTVDLTCREDGSGIPSTFWNGTTRLNSMVSATHTHVLTPDTEAGLSCRNEAGVLSNERRLAALPLELDLQDEPPRIQRVQRGQTVELPCDYRPGNLRELYEVFWSVREHDTGVDVQYRPNALPLEDLLSINEDTFALTVAANRLEQTGDQFHCIVDVRLNNIGSEEFRYLGATIELEVEDQPAEIVEDVQDVTVMMGGMATFTCGVIGTNLALSWEIDNRPYTGCDDETFCVTNTPASDSLMVTSTFAVDTEAANLDNNTEVVCKASQMGGTEVSSTARLIFQAAAEPTIFQPPTSKVVLANQINTVNFTCGAMGNPRPEISWMFNDATVIGAKFQNERIFANDTTTFHQLIFNQVQETDSGSIICVGRTTDPEIFVVQEKATLSVLTNNFNPEVEINNTGNLQIRFQLPAAIQDELRFLVRYTEAGTDQQRVQTITGNFINQRSIMFQVPSEQLPFSQFTLQIAMEVADVAGEFTPSVVPTMTAPTTDSSVPTMTAPTTDSGDPSLNPVAPIAGALGGLVIVLAIATAMIVLRLRIVRRKRKNTEPVYDNISLYNMQFQPNCAYIPSTIASTTRQHEANNGLSDTIYSDVADVNRLHEDDQARNESQNGNTSESAINEASDSQCQRTVCEEQSRAINHEQQPESGPYDQVQDYEQQPASGPYDQVQDYEQQPASGPYDQVQDYEQQPASGPYERAQDYEQQPASGPYERVQDYEQQPASGPYDQVQDYEQQPASGPYDQVQDYEQQPASGPYDQVQDYEQQPASGPYERVQDYEQQPASGPYERLQNVYEQRRVHCKK